MKTVERKKKKEKEGSEEGKKNWEERDEKEQEKGGREYYYEKIVNMIYTIIRNSDRLYQMMMEDDPLASWLHHWNASKAAVIS